MASFQNEVLFNLICESNIMSDIYIKYMDLSILGVNVDRLMYYIRFRDCVNKLLIYLPINDGIGIYACMRYFIEQFLKYVYSLYNNNDVSKINKTSYRHIKEDINSNTNIDINVKKEIEKIYSYYAKYSNDIHDKAVVYDKELNFLGDILKNRNDFICRLSDDLSNFLFISYNILNQIFNIDFNKLNAFERMSIAKMSSKKRKNRILNMLKYEK